ncbi:MAG: YkvA family protein [Bdellovibrionota bacterium]
MQIRTVKDLKAYLNSAGISADAFAASVQLSHMTIRRLLRSPDKKKILPKYHANFDAVTRADEMQAGAADDFLSGDAQDFGVLMSELEEKGRAVTDIKVVGSDMRKKLQLSKVGKGLRTRLETLFKAVADKSTSPKFRLLALGAIIYFVDPLDIIPDVLPGIGYIDDFSVISLVLGAMLSHKK